MKALTIKQKNIYNYLIDHIDKEGYPPTVREIGLAFSITAKAAYDHLRALEKKGTIKVEKRRSRAIEIVGSKPHLVRIPLVGRIAAGSPLAAEENIEELLTFPRDMFSEAGPFFALKVQGNSMKDAGVRDNDLAIVKQQSTANNGDIIAALIGDEATLKYFHQKGKSIILSPANEEYSDIKPELKNFSILGKLIGTYSDFSTRNL